MMEMTVAAFSPQVWLLIVCSLAVMLAFFKTARQLGSKHTISKEETDYIEMLPFRFTKRLNTIVPNKTDFTFQSSS